MFKTTCKNVANFGKNACFENATNTRQKQFNIGASSKT